MSGLLLDRGEGEESQEQEEGEGSQEQEDGEGSQEQEDGEGSQEQEEGEGSQEESRSQEQEEELSRSLESSIVETEKIPGEDVEERNDYFISQELKVSTFIHLPISTNQRTRCCKY